MNKSPSNFYATQQLAAHYDTDYALRPDILFYLELAQDLRAHVVADIGAGTGLLCSRMVQQGHHAIGVEPQATMLSLARNQPHGSDITWIEGTAANLDDESADLVLMTGHVAQYFLTQSAWVDVLMHARRALRVGGRVAFEIRNPQIEAWRDWATETPRDLGWGTLEGTVVRDGDLVTHVDRWTTGDEEWLTSETLRFPTWNDVVDGIKDAGLQIADAWGDWNKGEIAPASVEWIFVLTAQ